MAQTSVFWRGRNWEAVTAKIHWDGSKKRPSRILSHLCPKQKITTVEKQKEIEALKEQPAQVRMVSAQLAAAETVARLVTNQ
jgi:hypothetical protein